MAVLPFIEEQLPDDMAYQFVGSPTWLTQVAQALSGDEGRNSAWEDLGHSYSASFNNRLISHATGKSGIKLLKDFFIACRGRATGFRMLDHTDFRHDDDDDANASPATISVGDNTTEIWQITKTYSTPNGLQTYVRDIQKPKGPSWGDTVTIYINGTPLVLGENFTLDETTGLIDLAGGSGGTGPHGPLLSSETLAWTGQFHVAVRFATDKQDIVYKSFRIHSWATKLVEIRV